MTLLLWARMDLGVMAMKGYSIFSKAPELEPKHQTHFSVIPRSLVKGGVLPLSRDAVGVLYSPSRLG